MHPAHASTDFATIATVAKICRQDATQAAQALSTAKELFCNDTPHHVLQTIGEAINALQSIANYMHSTEATAEHQHKLCEQDLADEALTYGQDANDSAGEPTYIETDDD